MGGGAQTNLFWTLEFWDLFMQCPKGQAVPVDEKYKVKT